MALDLVYLRFTEEGLDGALWDRRQVKHRDQRSPPHRVGLQSSAGGPRPWTLRLLAGKVVELGLASSMSHEGVRRLKKPFSSRGQEWCIPKVSAELWMEDVLCTPNRMTPSVRWSALTRSTQFWGRPGPLCRPGHFPGGRTTNTGGKAPDLFLACEPLAGWWQVAVTQRRTMQDFAHQMRWLVDEAYPEVPVVGPEQISTPPRGVAVRDVPSGRGPADSGVPYTPKHGSWLNMAEIELACCPAAA